MTLFLSRDRWRWKPCLDGGCDWLGASWLSLAVVFKFAIVSLLLVGCLQYDQHAGPSPSPKPAPLGDVAWAIVIHEEADTTLEQSVLFNELEFWRGLATRGIGYRFLDDDNHPAVDPFLAAIAKKNVTEPALILMGKDGTVRKCCPLPKDAAGVKALLP